MIKGNFAKHFVNFAKIAPVLALLVFSSSCRVFNRPAEENGNPANIFTVLLRFSLSC